MAVLTWPEGVGVAELTREASGVVYRLYSGNRSQVLAQRAATTGETAMLVRAENGATLRAQVGDSLTALRASTDSLQAVVGKTNAQIGPGDTKDVARECRRVARQVLALSRLFLEALESADTGSA